MLFTLDGCILMYW